MPWAVSRRERAIIRRRLGLDVYEWHGAARPERYRRQPVRPGSSMAVPNRGCVVPGWQLHEHCVPLRSLALAYPPDERGRVSAAADLNECYGHGDGRPLRDVAELGRTNRPRVPVLEYCQPESRLGGR